MPFNPDQYLAEKTGATDSGFNPDQYLKEKTGQGSQGPPEKKNTFLPAGDDLTGLVPGEGYYTNGQKNTMWENFLHKGRNEVDPTTAAQIMAPVSPGMGPLRQGSNLTEMAVESEMALEKARGLLKKAAPYVGGGLLYKYLKNLK